MVLHVLGISWKTEINRKRNGYIANNFQILDFVRWIYSSIHSPIYPSCQLDLSYSHLPKSIFPAFYPNPSFYPFNQIHLSSHLSKSIPPSKYILPGKSIYLIHLPVLLIHLPIHIHLPKSILLAFDQIHPHAHSSIYPNSHLAKSTLALCLHKPFHRSMQINPIVKLPTSIHLSNLIHPSLHLYKLLLTQLCI